MSDYVRFSPWRRAEHFVTMIVFIALTLTGLPQKYFHADWARWMLEAFGGVDSARWIHRAAGLFFAVLFLQHIAVAIWMVAARRVRLSLVPDRKDFTDAILQMRYYLGLTDRGARFDRYDYRQKFEYWGMVFGALIVITTGLALLWPTLVTRVLPGEVIPASKVAHSSEGLLALLIVIVWHIYNAHLSPDVFPFDKSIFTGRISEHRMKEEHPLEWERIATEREADAAEADVRPVPTPERKAS